MNRRTLLGSLPAVAITAASSRAAATATVAESVPATIEQWAAIPFEPLPEGLELLDALPTLENLHNPGLVSAGLAVRLCCKSKAELIDMIRKMTADEKGEEAFVGMMDGIERSSDMLGAMVEVMECATARVLSAVSCIELEETGAA